MLRSLASSALPKAARPRAAQQLSLARRTLHSTQKRAGSSAAARILVERTIEKTEAATNGRKPAAEEEAPEVAAAAAVAAAEVQQSLPSVGLDERKVSVGWDGKVWSK